MAEFKKGDRVKVEYEGTVTFVYDDAVEVTGEGGRAGYARNPSDLTLIERPVEPLAPGSVVRNKRGTIWLVEEAGRVYTRDATGYGFRSSHNPLTLARAVRDENDLTLIYDGSNK